jgi:hypothetical protein
MRSVLIVAALLVVGMVTAKADTDTYTDVSRQPRGDNELSVATDACAQRYGIPQNGKPTSRQFKQCMMGYGWRYDRTKVEHTYIDPDTGMSCHDVGGAAICEPPQGTVHYQNDEGLSCTRTGILAVCTNL